MSLDANCIVSLDTHGFVSLESLDIHGFVSLEPLDIHGFVSLESLDTHGFVSLESLDIHGFVSLESLDTHGFVSLDADWFVSLDANCLPIFNAFPRKARYEVLLPSGPGFTPNTIPLPQWLAAVFSAWRQ